MTSAMMARLIWRLRHAAIAAALPSATVVVFLGKGNGRLARGGGSGEDSDNDVGDEHGELQ